MLLKTVTAEAISAVALPPNARTPATRQMQAIGRLAISELLGMPVAQVPFLKAESANGHAEAVLKGAAVIGLSACVSKVSTQAQTDTLHVVVPVQKATTLGRLDAHILLCVFVRLGAATENGDDSFTVEVPGWLEARDAAFWQTAKPTGTFNSKLRVLMVPVKAIRSLAALAAFVVQTNNRRKKEKR